MAWRIEYARSAVNELRSLDRQTARRIADYMEQNIASLDDPRVRGSALTGVLGGLWRYRIGDYRVVCELHDATVQILVLRVAHRRQVYR